MLLNKEGSCEFNKQEGRREMLLIKRSSKSKRRYWLVVKLKAIKYKEDFLCYLSATASLQGFLSLKPQDVVLPQVFHLLLLFCQLPYPPVTLEYVQSSPIL